MHRVAPIATAFRAYSAGGARSTVDAADDGKLMQEMKGGFMAGERRQKVEAPQNYGFTSVVQPSTGEGMGKKSAEAFISFIGGNRSFPVAAIMDDRRFRPMGLKPGENSQYDDLGQMTLIRRTGMFLLSLDSEDKSQQQGSGKAGDSGSGGQGKKVERMVSLRHVEKKQQDRQQQQQQKSSPAHEVIAMFPLDPAMTIQQREAVFARRAAMRNKLLQAQELQEQQDAQQKQDFKHEGETVNTEVRCTKNRIEFRTGDTVVGYYDVKDSKWYFEAKTIHSKASDQIKDEAPKIDHN